MVTVGLASVAFGETLTPAQLLGGGLVLASVLVVQWPGRTVSPDRVAIPDPLRPGVERLCG